jgi:hypothetical protein
MTVSTKILKHERAKLKKLISDYKKELDRLDRAIALLEGSRTVRVNENGRTPRNAKEPKVISQRTYTVEDKENALNLLKEGGTFKEVANKLLIPMSTISTWYYKK